MPVRAIGRQLAGLYLNPFLQIKLILACFRYVPSIVLKRVLKKRVFRVLKKLHYGLRNKVNLQQLTLKVPCVVCAIYNNNRDVPAYAFNYDINSMYTQYTIIMITLTMLFPLYMCISQNRKLVSLGLLIAQFTLVLQSTIIIAYGSQQTVHLNALLITYTSNAII